MNGGLEETDFEETFDAVPGSMQPVVVMGAEGRTLENMRWGFKFTDRFLFDVRSEGVTSANFWKDKFAATRCIVPASSYFEWQGEKAPKPKYEIEIPGHDYFGIAGVWASWKNPKTELWEKTFSDRPRSGHNSSGYSATYAACTLCIQTQSIQIELVRFVPIAVNTELIFVEFP